MPASAETYNNDVCVCGGSFNGEFREIAGGGIRDVMDYSGRYGYSGWYKYSGHPDVMIKSSCGDFLSALCPRLTSTWYKVHERATPNSSSVLPFLENLDKTFMFSGGRAVAAERLTHGSNIPNPNLDRANWFSLGENQLAFPWGSFRRGN